MNQTTIYLYRHVQNLQKFNHLTPAARLPQNGIYIFFERGEVVGINGKTFDRIVRVGTHKSQNRFRGRIRQHYGNKSSLKGNKNSSVFRRHIGEALVQIQSLFRN